MVKVYFFRGGTFWEPREEVEVKVSPKNKDDFGSVLKAARKHGYLLRDGWEFLRAIG